MFAGTHRLFGIDVAVRPGGERDQTSHRDLGLLAERAQHIGILGQEPMLSHDTALQEPARTPSTPAQPGMVTDQTRRISRTTSQRPCRHRRAATTPMTEDATTCAVLTGPPTNAAAPISRSRALG